VNAVVPDLEPDPVRIAWNLLHRVEHGISTGESFFYQPTPGLTFSGQQLARGPHRTFEVCWRPHPDVAFERHECPVFSADRARPETLARRLLRDLDWGPP
jgi:hypothetical protein